MIGDNMLGEKELKEIVSIGILLTTEKNKKNLLNMLLTKAMSISNCDAGTLYLYEDDVLKFNIMKTITQNVSRGVDDDGVELPPVPMKDENVCAYSAIHREFINIPDVYDSERFDFSGPKKYDAITGYRTVSMLVIPLEDSEGILVGVLQLINKQGENGEIIPFTGEDEFLIRSIGSMAAVSMSSMLYVEEIKEQLHSFVSAFSTAVDERTPYNGAHTRKVAVYTSILAEYINKMHGMGLCEEYFDDNRKEQLILAAALHDIGKMITPLEVMNKETRMDGKMERVESRYQLLQAYYEIDMLKGRISKEKGEEEKKYLEESLAFIYSVNTSGFLQDEELERIEEIASKTYVTEQGEEIPYLTKEEKCALSIRKGTLTDEERMIMQDHVVMTSKILEKVHFNVRYCNVARFAAAHHELLDGSGYPNHLSGDELELEVRMLAVADVYDALTCKDRPYKVPIPRPKAFAILHSMAEEGKLEERLVAWLEEALMNIDDAMIERRVEVGF